MSVLITMGGQKDYLTLIPDELFEVIPCVLCKQEKFEGNQH